MVSLSLVVGLFLSTVSALNLQHKGDGGATGSGKCQRDCQSTARQGFVRRITGISFDEPITKRRDYLQSTIRQGFVGLLAGTAFGNVETVLAAPPMTAGEADNVGARLSRRLRAPPPKVLRNKLNQDFAVLLMRSSYNVLDELDVVAMNQFQRDFFLIRQAEYETYVSMVPGVKQGDLTDPYYFDFISFAQYKAINRVIMDPAVVFEEQQPVEVGEGEPQQFVSRVVKRDSSLANAALPSEHSKRVGQLILERFDEIYAGSKSGLPRFSGARATPNEMLAILEQLVRLFLLNGFAWDGSASLVSESPNGKLQFCLSLVSPATLWGGRALQSENCSLGNDFLLKVAQRVVERYGYHNVGGTVKYEGNSELTYLTML